MNRHLPLFLLLGALDCPLAVAQGGPPTCLAWNQYSPKVRAEGLTELVSDVLVICSDGTAVRSGAAIPAFDMKLSFNAKVTSRIMGADGKSSEALLLLDEPAPGAQFPCDTADGVCQGFGNGSGFDDYGAGPAGPLNNRNVFQGAVDAGNTLVWKAIPFDPPGAGNFRVFRFTNLRLDAASLAGGAVNLGTTSITITGPSGTIPVTSDSLTLATAQASLIATVRDAANAGESASGVTVPVSAAANVVRVATLRFAGAFFQADKVRTAAPYTNADTSPLPVDQNVPGGILGNETGFSNASLGSYGARGNLGTAGLADSGTRYMAVINNIPPGVDVYVDTSNSTAAVGPTARLIQAGASGTGAFVAAAGSGNKTQLAVSGGTAIAVWEVLRTADVGTDQFDFGVYLSHPASSAATPPASTDIQMMYAPTGGHATPPTNAVPVFDGTSKAQNLFTYTLAAPLPTPIPTPTPTPTPSPVPTPSPTPTPSGPPTSTSPTLIVAPLSMSFAGTAGASNPPQEFLQLSCATAPTGFSISSGGTIVFEPFPTEGVTYRMLSISVNLKRMAAGTYHDTLTVTNTIDGTVTPVAVSLTVNPAPQISSLSVSAVQAGGPGFTLAVNGSNLTDVYVVRWNGSVLFTTYVNDGQLRAQVPASLIQAAGSADITVTSADGATSNSISLAIEKFTISSLSPDRATAGDAGFTLTVGGSGLVPGATVKFAGTELKTSSATSTQITAAVPANLIANDGAIPVSVSSPEGTVSNPLSFTVAPVFRIDTLSPSGVLVGGPAFTLEISGAGFVRGTTIHVGTVEFLPDSLTAGRIVVTVPAGIIAREGPLTVSVLRPGLPPSNALTLKVSPLPAITALDPPSVAATGASFTLAVMGTDFLPGATVRWNARALTTTMVSSTRLTAAVPAGLTASVGMALIDVSAGVGAFSNATMIRINPSPPPTLISISPAAITVATAPAGVTLSGVGFAAGCAVVFTPPAGATVRIAADSCGPTEVAASLPASVLGAPGLGRIQIANPDGLSSAWVQVVVALPPFPGLSFAPPPFVPSGQDQPLTLTLNGVFPVTVQGTLTMTFTADGDLPDDPAIQFQNGSRLFAFSVPAGTQPQIRVAMKSGTVAGLITLTPSFTAGGQDVTPPGGVVQRIQIARAEPFISLLTCTRTPSGLVAVVDGFTNTREATQASFDLQSESGASLGTAELGADAPLLFNGWFGREQGAASGGLFRYTQAFTTPIDALKGASATVKLSNTIGWSATASCQVQ